VRRIFLLLNLSKVISVDKYKLFTLILLRRLIMNYTANYLKKLCGEKNLFAFDMNIEINMYILNVDDVLLIF